MPTSVSEGCFSAPGDDARARLAFNSASECFRAKGALPASEWFANASDAEADLVGAWGPGATRGRGLRRAASPRRSEQERSADGQRRGTKLAATLGRKPLVEQVREGREAVVY